MFFASNTTYRLWRRGGSAAPLMYIIKVLLAGVCLLHLSPRPRTPISRPLQTRIAAADPAQNVVDVYIKAGT